MIAELLRGVSLFHELTDADLARIAQRARLVDVPAGTCLIAEGSEPEAMYVVVDGDFAITKRGMALNRCGPGDLLGELALLEGRVRSASVTAATTGRVIVLDTTVLHDLLRGSLAATLAILRTMAARIANTESVQRQHDMLASLGKVAAGLAHELDNPAAAIQRGAAELGELIATLERTVPELRAPHPAGGIDAAALARRPAAVTGETAMQRARRERALEDALAARGIASPHELAPLLGCDPAELDAVVAGIAPDAVPALLRWLAATSSARAVAHDVGTAAKQISALVGAVRSHSQLGRAPVQDVDIHAGLDDTLALFRHRLGGITVRRDYGELPRITAYASELNQVWTNLVDNALDAMGPTGELAIVTRAIGDAITVDIIDSGPGIPPALQFEVWSPFVTTKPPGEGTGLGLHLAYTVIVARHRGRIELESHPGHTRFRVTLPIG